MQKLYFQLIASIGKYFGMIIRSIGQICPDVLKNGNSFQFKNQFSDQIFLYSYVCVGSMEKFANAKCGQDILRS